MSVLKLNCTNDQIESNLFVCSVNNITSEEPRFIGFQNGILIFCSALSLSIFIVGLWIVRKLGRLNRIPRGERRRITRF